MGKETLCNIDGMLHFKKEDRSSSEIADEDEKLYVEMLLGWG